MLSEQFTCNTNFYFLVIYTFLSQISKNVLSASKLLRYYFSEFNCKLATPTSVPNMMSQEEALSLPSHLRGSTSISNPNSNSVKRKRSLPGTPDLDAEVISMSPKSLMATNRFICEVCNKGFQRDQNLQLHRRGHNLPWKLKQRNSQEVVKKKVYVCPEKTCVHNHPSRALGDLTGIKKHFSRKHGEKKWKCQKCSKKYAVQSDWKAHSKICGTREYKCDCGTLFSRKDSFLTHRAFCEALGERSGRIASVQGGVLSNFGNNILMNVQAPRIQQNLAGFNKEFGGPCSETSMANFADGDHGHKLMKLPLWLDNIQSNSTSNVFSSSSCTIPDIGLTSNTSQGQWVNCRYHEQESSFITSGPLSISATMSQGVLKLEQEENKVDLSHSVTSFYPSYQNSSQGIFSNSNNNVFGFLPSNNNLSNTSSSNIVEIKKLFKQVNEDEKNFNDMVNCQGSSRINNVGEWKSQQPQVNSSLNNRDDQLSLTRDFLGVGDDSLNRSFLHEHELANFNPMMNMQESQFGEHYG